MKKTGRSKPSGEVFLLTDGFNFGPCINKSSQSGVVFGHLLENLEKRISLKKIAELSNWTNPSSSIRRLVRLVNSWSGYKIHETKGRKTNYYLMEKEDVKYPYNPEDKIVTYSL